MSKNKTNAKTSTPSKNDSFVYWDWEFDCDTVGDIIAEMKAALVGGNKKIVAELCDDYELADDKSTPAELLSLFVDGLAEAWAEHINGGDNPPAADAEKKSGNEPSSDDDEKATYDFSHGRRCPRCKTINNHRYSGRPGIQYRQCDHPICARGGQGGTPFKWTVYGEKI